MRRRLCAAYHIERSIANRLGLIEYPCACTRCRGGRLKKVEIVARHHRAHGRDPYLIYPVMTVDGQNVQRPARPSHRQEELYRQERHDNRDEGLTWPRRTVVDVENMARDAFGRVDEIHDDVLGEDGQIPDDVIDSEGDASWNEENLEYLVRESTQPVFEGSTLNRLQCGIVFFSLCSLYSVPQTFMDAMLIWIAGDLLPTSNCFPRSSYEVKTMLMRLGLRHRQVHCCPDGHVLYEGDNEDLLECPMCKQHRYIPGSNKVPQRIVRYFDIIQRLQRMFKCPEVAKHMTWYDSHKSRGQMMRCASDSLQWKNIDRIYPDFAEVKTNLRLGLVGDGIIPYKNNAIKHSTWVFLITIYNLPPWLLTKKFFISLAVLIPGPKSATADNIDVFLRPLVHDLLKLWRGVSAINMSKPEGERRFTLRALLLWTVNDFPAYGLLSGQQTHGYKGCPLCGPETCAEHAPLLRKMIYLGGRRYLHPNHPFRRARVAFNNHPEWDMAPDRPTGEEILQWGSEREEFINAGGVENSDDDPVKRHGVKRKTILSELPYWKDHLVRHALDPMHCEKNLCENLLKTTLGEKDCPAVRADMQARNIRPHLHLQVVPGPSGNRFYMPDATYVLSVVDKAKVLRVMKSLRTPTNYASNLHNKISKGKLSSLKSHDYHVLMQQILPLCFRKISNKSLARAVIRVSRVFKRICEKTVNGEDKEQLKAECAETMCLLEKEMPPSFFDVMSHLLNHIVEELFLCGPVHTRWMYPYERYFKNLKGFVKNLAKPEASIAQGYQVEEALGFITEYMTDYNITSRRVWDDKEEPTMVDEILEGKGKPRELSEELRNTMHAFVLDNASHLEAYRERYEQVWEERTTARAEFRRRHPRRSGRRWEPYPIGLEEVPPFFEWIQRDIEDAKGRGILVPEDVEDSSKPPSLQARRFKSMYAYGYHYRVKSAEGGLTTLDSGIAAIFRRPCRSGRRDQNPVEANLEYIGQILEIVELNYGRHCTVLFVCEWVKANYRGRNATVKRDEWGFSMANFNSLLPFGYESLAFPINCDQVFFSDDEDEPGWKVVLRTEVRGRRIDNEKEEEEETEMFRMGENSDFEGLRIAAVIDEETAVPIRTGRNIGMNEVLGDGIEETVSVFDRDIGESSEDDD